MMSNKVTKCIFVSNEGQIENLSLIVPHNYSNLCQSLGTRFISTEQITKDKQLSEHFPKCDWIVLF